MSYTTNREKEIKFACNFVYISTTLPLPSITIGTEQFPYGYNASIVFKSCINCTKITSHRTNYLTSTNFSSTKCTFHLANQLSLGPPTHLVITYHLYHGRPITCTFIVLQSHLKKNFVTSICEHALSKTLSLIHVAARLSSVVESDDAMLVDCFNLLAYLCILFFSNQKFSICFYNTFFSDLGGFNKIQHNMVHCQVSTVRTFNLITITSTTIISIRYS